MLLVQYWSNVIFLIVFLVIYGNYLLCYSMYFRLDYG